MKKFLRFYLPIFLSIAAIGIFTLGYLAARRSTLEYLFGGAKMISPAKKASIKIDGIESNSSQLFESEGRFYFVTKDSRLSFHDLLVIDKTKNDVALPNSGCADVLFSNYLFLEECGYGGVFYSNKVKMSGFDTQLNITGSAISFILPSNRDFVTPEHKIEIIFKGE